MKKILFTLALALVTTMSMAQNDAKQAFEVFKKVNSLTAVATQTTHKAASNKDNVTKGTFYFKAPSKMTFSMNKGKDRLTMNGTKFTMAKSGISSSISNESKEQWIAFMRMFTCLANGGQTYADFAKVATIESSAKGSVITVTVTPKVSDPKAKKKLMFTSFVLVADAKSNELKSVRLNQKAGNYTEYSLSAYQKNVTVSDSVFK